MTSAATTLKPRKSPVQARSTATVETLHAAAIQVLVHEGLQRCTTTRIAERAGTSVGSLYQYYPNRDALIADVLAQHLDSVATAIEDTCRAEHGSHVADMARSLVTTYLATKLSDPEKSKALYAVSRERGGAAHALRLRKRATTAIADMLVTARDARFDDPIMTAMFVLSIMYGPVQTVLEYGAPQKFKARLGPELTQLVTAYLRHVYT